VRQIDYIGQFTTDIKHVSGKENVAADFFSRIESVHQGTEIDYELLSQYQRQDDELLSILEQNQSGLQLKLINIPGSNSEIYCDVSTKRIRPYVTKQLRHAVFHSIHNLSHPSKRSTVKLISERYVWQSMNTDITKMVTECVACQKSKVGRHNKSALAEFKVSDKRFTPSRHRGTASVGKWFSLLSHMHRPLQSLASSYTYGRGNSRSSGQGFTQWLDPILWTAKHHNDRPRQAV